MPDPGSVSSSVAFSPPPSDDPLFLIRMPGTKSWVHSHFHVYTCNNKLANCDLCKRDVKWGDSKWGSSTSSLSSHIKNRHRDVYDAALAEQAKAATAAADEKAKQPKQKTLTTFFSGATKDNKERALLKF